MDNVNDIDLSGGFLTDSGDWNPLELQSFGFLRESLDWGIFTLSLYHLAAINFSTNLFLSFSEHIGIKFLDHIDMDME